MIVSISGVAGTGKSVVAKLLAKELKWKFLKLDDLARKKKLFLYYDRKRRSQVVDMRKVLLEFNKEVKKHENVVTEGLYSHFFPSDILVILRCEPSILEKRLKKKYTWPTKIKENVEAEMINLITEEALDLKKNVYEVDTTKKTPRQTVNSIKEIINGKTGKYVAGRFNWLT